MTQKAIDCARRENGTALTLGIVLAALVLIVAGTVIAFGAAHSKKATTTTSTAGSATAKNTPAPSARASASPKASVSASPTPALRTGIQALGQVKAFYGAYVKSTSNVTSIQLINQYATSSVLAGYQQTTTYDAVTCSQNPLSAIAYSAPTYDGQNAIIKLTTSVGGQSAGTILVTIRLTDLRIVQINCNL